MNNDVLEQTVEDFFASDKDSPSVKKFLEACVRCDKKTIREIVPIKKEDWRKWQNMGTKSLDEIEGLLKDKGLKFEMTNIS